MVDMSAPSDRPLCSTATKVQSPAPAIYFLFIRYNGSGSPILELMGPGLWTRQFIKPISPPNGASGWKPVCHGRDLDDPEYDLG